MDIEIRGERQQATKSKIYLVDLAGSEGYQKANGERKQEGRNINKSLLALS